MSGTITESKCEVVTDFHECKFTSHPNAEEITDHIPHKTLNKFGIKLEQVMGILTDSPNVMKGHKN